MKAPTQLPLTDVLLVLVRQNASGAKTWLSTSIASGSREPGRPDAGACNAVLRGCGGRFNSPLNLFISFAKALREPGFPSDSFGEGQVVAIPQVGGLHHRYDWRAA